MGWGFEVSDPQFSEKINIIVSKLEVQKDKIILIMDGLISKLREINAIDEGEVESSKNDMLSPINRLIELISELNSIDKYTNRFLNRKIENIGKNTSQAGILLNAVPFDVEKLEPVFNGIESDIDDMLSLFRQIEAVKYHKESKEEADKLIQELKGSNEKLLSEINKVNVIADDLKNKKLHEIFEDDSKKFKLIARFYEVAFYVALAFLFLYFFGWYVEIDTVNLKFKLAEQFHGNHTPTFYVQKISLIILSTTLAAFLLKRSFMNRRLADDAYRTAKELDALPRYMEGMSDEMKEKIRFDLAYKYFGNGIHHESYTGGENLMHENIKTNTDFIRAIKDAPTESSEK